jgi:hypothetical protein
VIGIGGFQPVAVKRLMSIFSSGSTTLPVASRNTEVGRLVRRRVVVDEELA